ncbi:hypothetical protein LTR60_005383 [Cryomyces antarcticus]|nr:hypothetical protein LTR60_005383 [Cryomyces antarcticus]
MAPNLFLLTQKAFTPHHWFKRTKSESKPTRNIEHWDAPVAGSYEYIAGRGWYLIATDAEGALEPSQRQKIIYSKVVKRNLLQPEYDSRKRRAVVKVDETAKTSRLGFFRLDDGLTWVCCWDADGKFVPGPWERWVEDKVPGTFRKMLKGDDPAWQSKRNSVSASASASASTAASRTGSTSSALRSSERSGFSTVASSAKDSAIGFAGSGNSSLKLDGLKIDERRE